MIKDVEKLFEKLVEGVDAPESAVKEGVESRVDIYHLSITRDWLSSEFAKVDFLSKRFEIGGKLYLGYSLDGKRKNSNVLDDATYLELFSLILYKAMLLDSARREHNKESLIKRFNTLFKARAIISPKWLCENEVLALGLENSWLMAQQRKPSISSQELEARELSDQKGKELAVLPMTVLFYEGPIARAYLETIKSLGYKPQKIIQLVSSVNLSSGKPVGRFFPKGMRMAYADSIQKGQIHHWPRKIKKDYGELTDGFIGKVAEGLNFSRASIETANGLKRLSVYSDCVEQVMISKLSDPALARYLACEEGLLLYTGGGIVPEQVLNIHGLKFIHVHPGFLPEVRGADCTLWSSLLYGRLSSSCFIMAPGIDTGDILRAQWLPNFSLKGLLYSKDKDMLYRLIYSYLDPWLRAYTLREFLLDFVEGDELIACAQDRTEGYTYHFMSPELKKCAIENLLSIDLSEV